MISSCATIATAQALDSSLQDRLAKVEAATTAAQSSGDNAWMLVSTALVLMMTGPGLALFYGGLVRKKNVLGTMMQSFILMAVVSVLWVIYGYSLAFGSGKSFIGGFVYVFFRGVVAEPNAGYAAAVTQQKFQVLSFNVGI